MQPSQRRTSERIEGFAAFPAAKALKSVGMTMTMKYLGLAPRATQMRGGRLLDQFNGPVVLVRIRGRHGTCLCSASCHHMNRQATLAGRP
jgi:hypothetical protein